MATSAGNLVRRLDAIARRYGPGRGEPKRELIVRLGRRALKRPEQLLRYHEILCFLRAYPDDAALLAAVEAALRAFPGRSDLRRHRALLADSGIAGTVTSFPFYWATARWLVERWPDRVEVDWDAFASETLFERIVPLLVPYCESPGIDSFAFSAREWLATLKGKETDAAFLLKRVAALPGDDFTRESFYEALDPSLRILPGMDTPSRSLDCLPARRVHFQRAPLDRSRPDLRAEILRPPRAVRALSSVKARDLIDLARAAMVTRSRDLDAFMYADPADVRLVDCGDGLEFACMGMRPERRLMFEAVYGFLTLKNGLPIGYVLASSLFGSTEIAYNVFDSFRGGEAGRIFGRVMGMARHLFGADAFSIDPFQLGHDNAEGQQSGAWWFYYKFGFRPEDPGVRRLLKAELARMKADPDYRSSPETLHELAATHVFYYLGRPRRDTLAHVSLGDIGLAITRCLAARGGADRESALAACSTEAARLLGLGSRRGFSAGERLAWERWSPLVLSLPGLDRWPEEERRRLIGIIRAKGGRRESDFVQLCNGHARLRRALLRLAAES